MSQPSTPSGGGDGKYAHTPAATRSSAVTPPKTTSRRTLPLLTRSPLQREENLERLRVGKALQASADSFSPKVSEKKKHRSNSVAAAGGQLVVGIDGVSRSKREESASNLKMEILFHLASTSLDNLKREFELKTHQSGLPGLPLADFVDVLQRRLPEHLLHGKQRRSRASLQDDEDDDDDDAIVKLCELHADIDADSSGTVEWEEFTRFVMDEGSVADAVADAAASHQNSMSVIRTAELPGELGVASRSISRPIDLAVHLGVSSHSNADTYAIVPRGSFDMQIYGSDSGQLLSTLKGHQGVITAVTGLPQYGYIASASNDGELRLWEPGARYAGRFQAVSTHGENVMSLEYLPWTSLLWLGGSEGTLMAYDVANIAGHDVHDMNTHAKPQWRREGAHDGEVTSICEMEHIETLVSSGSDNVIRLWDPTRTYSGQHAKPKMVLRGHSKGILSTAFSKAHKVICSGGFDRTVCLWDPFIRRPVHKIPLGGSVGGLLTPSTHDEWLVTVSSDGHMRIFDVRMYKQLHSHIVNKRADWMMNDSVSRGAKDRIGGSRTDVTSLSLDERLDRFLMCDGESVGRNTTLYAFEVDEDLTRVRIRNEEARKWQLATAEANRRGRLTSGNLIAAMTIVNATIESGGEDADAKPTDVLGSMYKPFGASTVGVLYSEHSLNIASFHPLGCFVYDAVTSLSLRSNNKLTAEQDTDKVTPVPRTMSPRGLRSRERPSSRTARTSVSRGGTGLSPLPPIERSETSSKKRTDPVEVTRACLDASGRRLLIGDSRGNVTMWALSNLVKLRDCIGHNNREVTGLAYGHCGEDSTEPSVFVSCGLDGTVNLSVDDGSDPDPSKLLTLNRDRAGGRRRGGATSSPFSSEGDHAGMHTSSHAQLTVEDAMFTNSKRFFVPGKREATCCTITPVERSGRTAGDRGNSSWLFAVGCRDGDVYVWLDSSPRVRCTLRCSTSGFDEVTAVLFCIKSDHEDKRRRDIVLAAGDTSGTLRIWSAPAIGLSATGTLQSAKQLRNRAMSMVPDTPFTPSVTRDREGFLSRASTRGSHRVISRASSRASTSMGFFRDSEELLDSAIFNEEDMEDWEDSDGDDGSAAALHMHATTPLARFSSLDGRGDDDNGGKGRRSGTSHCGLSALAFDGVNDILYVGDDGGFIGAYELQRERANLAVNKIRTIHAHSDTVVSVSVISASHHILTGSFAGKAKLWNVQTGDCDGILGDADEQKSQPGFAKGDVHKVNWYFPESVPRVPKARLDAREKAELFDQKTCSVTAKPTYETSNHVGTFLSHVQEQPSKKKALIGLAETWELNSILKVANPHGHQRDLTDAQRKELLEQFGVDDIVEKRKQVQEAGAIVAAREKAERMHKVRQEKAEKARVKLAEMRRDMFENPSRELMGVRAHFSK
ncbi:EF-hand domain-containing protein [Pseudoscourfieldia marina]